MRFETTNTSESTYPKALQIGTCKFRVSTYGILGHSDKFVALDRVLV